MFSRNKNSHRLSIAGHSIRHIEPIYQYIYAVLPFLPFLTKKPAPRPPACSQGSPLRSDKREKHAPLTAPTARRLGLPGRVFAFNAPLSVVPLRSKKGKRPKGVFSMWQTSKQPAFGLGQIVATPGALAALSKSGQQPGEFLTRHVNREWGDLSDEDRKENEYSLERGSGS